MFSVRFWEAAVVERGALVAAVDEFTAAVHDEFTVEDVLRQLAQSAVRVLAVDGAGVMVPVDDDVLRFRFATTGAVSELGALQEQLQEGPCRDSRAAGRVLNIADLAVEGAWPAYQARAAALGIRAMTAIPLLARGQACGVLHVYRTRAQRLDKQELAAAQTLASLATSYLLVAADRDAARRAYEPLARHAMHDPLTGVPVRWVFLEQLAHALLRLQRDGGQVAVLFLDLDGLKYVNDTYGHSAGDRLLTACVQRLRDAVRPPDVVARIGGDEFVVLLEQVGGADETGKIAQRVLDRLAEPYHCDGATLQPSASIGVAVTGDPQATPDTLIAHADAAMYAAKRAGRGRFEVFNPVGYATERAAALARDELGAALHAAVHDGLKPDELEVHYQPIVELDAAPGRERALYAVEALVRWRHPSRGLLTAAEFVPAAERAGLLVELDDWVLHQTCRQLVAWDRHLGPQAPQRAFLNVTADELAHSALPARVGAALAETGLSPARLTLEVTETGLFTNAHAADTALAALLGLGCSLAIDDFGAGYSSLARMEQVPAAVIKIDGSFARDLQRRPVAAAVISAVLLLGQRLHRTVIIEGVEDADTLQVLRGLGATQPKTTTSAGPTLRRTSGATAGPARPRRVLDHLRTRARCGPARLPNDRRPDAAQPSATWKG
jgi:diguanylate cyclase (GGDEF)-like protein